MKWKKWMVVVSLVVLLGQTFVSVFAMAETFQEENHESIDNEIPTDFSTSLLENESQIPPVVVESGDELATTSDELITDTTEESSIEMEATGDTSEIEMTSSFELEEDQLPADETTESSDLADKAEWIPGDVATNWAKFSPTDTDTVKWRLVNAQQKDTFILEMTGGRYLGAYKYKSPSVTTGAMEQPWYSKKDKIVKLVIKDSFLVRPTSVPPTVYLNGLFAGMTNLVEVVGMEKLQLDTYYEISRVSLDNMFEGNLSMENVDISGLGNNSVPEKSMKSMFKDANSLKALNLSNWDTSNAKMENFFLNTYSLQSLRLGPQTKLLPNSALAEAAVKAPALSSYTGRWKELGTAESIENPNGYWNGRNNHLIARTETDEQKGRSVTYVWDTVDAKIKTRGFFEDGDMQSNDTVWYIDQYGILHLSGGTVIGGFYGADLYQVGSQAYSSPWALHKNLITGIEIDNTVKVLPSVEGVTSIFELFSKLPNAISAKKMENLDVSLVKNMGSLFSGSNKLRELDLSSWDVSNVTYMNNLFFGMTALTALDVSTWNVSNVVNMNTLFGDVNSLASLDLSGWENEGASTSNMFENMTSLKSLTLGKNTHFTVGSNLPEGGSDGSSPKKGASYTGRWQSLGTATDITKPNGSWIGRTENLMFMMSEGAQEDIVTYVWETIDTTFYRTKEGKVAKGYVLTDNASNAKASNSGDTIWYIDEKNQTLHLSAGTFIGGFIAIGKYITEFGTQEVPWARYQDVILGIEVDNQIKVFGASSSSNASLAYFFSNLSNVVSTKGMGNLDVSLVNNMVKMFSSTSGLVSLDLSSWDTSNVEYMLETFSNMNSLTTLNLSSWDTSKVLLTGGVFMSSMFVGTNSLKSLTLGEKTKLRTEAGLAAPPNNDYYTGKWTILGNGTPSAPQGPFLADVNALYAESLKGKKQTYVWEPKNRIFTNGLDFYFGEHEVSEKTERVPLDSTQYPEEKLGTDFTMNIINRQSAANWQVNLSLSEFKKVDESNKILQSQQFPPILHFNEMSVEAIDTRATGNLSYPETFSLVAGAPAQPLITSSIKEFGEWQFKLPFDAVLLELPPNTGAGAPGDYKADLIWSYDIVP